MRTKRTLIGLLAVALVTGALQFSGALPLINSFVQQASAPILSPAKKFSKGFANFISVFTGLNRLSKENNELKSKLAEFSGNVAELAEIRKENEALKKQLGVKETKGYILVPARIISYGGAGYEETLLLDRGKNDGVESGMVVVFENNLIGRVKNSSRFTSELSLVTSPNSAVVGQIVNRAATGIVRGKIGAGILGMEEIELGKKIAAGDLVSSAKIAKDVPPGLVLGLVEDVQRKDNAVFQSARVRPILDFAELEIVFVIVRSR